MTDDDFARAAFREREARQIVKRRAFWLHLSIWAAVNVFLVVIWALAGGGYPWFLFVIFGWGVGVVAHAATAFLMSDPTDIVLAREQKRLSNGG